jgi:phosphate transport system permease protein
LFFPARARLVGDAALPPELRTGGVLALGVHAPVDDKWIVADVANASGTFHFVDVKSGDELGQADAAAAVTDKKAPRQKLLRAAPSGQGLYTLCWSTGAVTLVKITARTELAGKPLPHPKMVLETLATVAADKSGVPEQAVMYRTGSDSSRCAAVYDGKKIVVTTLSTDITGDSESKTVINEGIPSEVTALAMASDGKMLYAGTAGGSLLWWKLDDQGAVVERDMVPPASDKLAITSLDLMLGDVTLVAGDAGGAVTNWFFTTPDTGQSRATTADTPRSGKLRKEVKKLTYIRSLAPHGAAIRELVPSPRNRGLLIRDERGVATMDYTTNQRRLVSLANVGNVAFGPRGDMIAGIEDGHVKAWHLEGELLGWRSSLYPEVSWSGLWGRVWYEGLSEPEFSWQPQRPPMPSRNSALCRWFLAR